MKSFISRSLFGRSCGLLCSLVLAGSVYAGPSPQFANRTPSPAAPPAVSAPAAAPMACPQCETRTVSEFSATSAGGKWAPHAVAVGVEHDCASCGGAIAAVRGRTTNSMTDHCPVCAQAQPACCSANG